MMIPVLVFPLLILLGLVVYFVIRNAWYAQAAVVAAAVVAVTCLLVGVHRMREIGVDLVAVVLFAVAGVLFLGAAFVWTTIRRRVAVA